MGGLDEGNGNGREGEIRVGRVVNGDLGGMVDGELEGSCRDGGLGGVAKGG